jgi:pimeloyl-ACP methyl ester carboxylesterase
MARSTAGSNVRIRRGFVDVGSDQIHYRAIGLEGGGGSNLPLVCLHQSPFSSLTYQEILPLLAPDRTVVAFDTPGFGESFRPTSKPAIPDYASWLQAAALGLGLQRFDLMGLFTGAAIAADMAVRFAPLVRRLVLLGPPLFTPEQQDLYRAEAWPMRPRPDGSHLLPEWRRVMERSLPDVDFARRCDAFQEFWRGGGDAIWGEEAVSVYPLKDTLTLIRQAVLVIEADGLLGQTARALDLLTRASHRRLEGVRGWSMMQTAPLQIAEWTLDFLDGTEPE